MQRYQPRRSQGETRPAPSTLRKAEGGVPKACNEFGRRYEQSRGKQGRSDELPEDVARDGALRFPAENRPLQGLGAEDA